MASSKSASSEPRLSYCTKRFTIASDCFPGIGRGWYCGRCFGGQWLLFTEYALVCRRWPRGSLPIWYAMRAADADSHAVRSASFATSGSR